MSKIPVVPRGAGYGGPPRRSDDDDGRMSRGTLNIPVVPRGSGNGGQFWRGMHLDDEPSSDGRRYPPVIRRRAHDLETTCISNFYPIHFRAKEGNTVDICIFHCYFRDVDADEPIVPREDTELKRAIFEAPRQEGRQRMMEDALGVRCLEFGGDCAAGLRVDPLQADMSSVAMGHKQANANEDAAEKLVLDCVDRYEVLMDHDHMYYPCVVREVCGAGQVSVEVYGVGSFWSEMLSRSGPHVVVAADVRPRGFEILRGEVLFVPEYHTLTLYPGQFLRVQVRGPSVEEPPGRLVLGLGAGVCNEGGTVEFEGILEMRTNLEHPQHGKRLYKVEIEHIKVLLVNCLEGVPDLPHEERGVVLQCFTWVFERAYREMQMKTLGGRGWYRQDESETFEPSAKSMTGDRRIPTRVFLYRGYAASAVQVAAGPCLKIDLSVRMVQGITALAKLDFYRDKYLQLRKARDEGIPTKQEMEDFLSYHMLGRTCMTEHNHIHYRIKKVCLDMTVESTFTTPEGVISYKDYFLRRHGLQLDPMAPMLHCPFRGKQELYLPAQLATLTGLDEDWRTDREFAQDLWRGLRYEPDEHWKMQARLTGALWSQAEGGGSNPLRDWGIEVGKEPVEAQLKLLPRHSVYFDRQADSAFKQGRAPHDRYDVPMCPEGFSERPWPEVWTPANTRLVLDRWIIFRSRGEEEEKTVSSFIDELRPLVGELLENDGDNRMIISEPLVVGVPGSSAEQWTDFIRNYATPWNSQDTKVICVVIPAHVRRRDQYYYQLKDLILFQQATGVISQMLLGSTLQRTQQRQQIWKNIIQQLLIKQGAFMWVISPLPYRGRVLMVVGIDACKQSQDSPSIQTLCASTNPYFTTYFTTWRTSRSSDFSPRPGAMLREAMLNFYRKNGRLPTTIIVYRGGVSESQESVLIQGEVLQTDEGILDTLRSLPQEVGLPADEAEIWQSSLELGYILVRRGTNARFRTKDNQNLQSGSYIDNTVVVKAASKGIPQELQRYDFYMVSQTYVIGTAKPTLYSVLYSTLSLPQKEVIMLSYRLCSVYMTFSGIVSMPAPLKYACKLLSLLSKCENVTETPVGAMASLKSQLFFV